MDFVGNKEPQIKEMLQILGIKSIEELFCAVPEKLRLAALAEDDGLSEYEGMCWMESLAAKNIYAQFDNYLGAGAYEHHVPVLVGSICSKGEFLTAYTPYQAEASQGMLQIIFEFQSALCALTGLEVANASLYDGASACAEAMLMALRHNKERTKVLMGQSVHPHYRAVVEQYLISHNIQVETIPFINDGTIDQKRLHDLLDDNTAAVLLQYPNFFGVVDDIKIVVEKIRSVEALMILAANPLVYGLYTSAGELGADIAVGDGQPFGLPLQFGGPYVGYIACRQDLLRQLPGRIVGETKDTQGRRGFVLTLQAREQHIRREKATSNICTNQALAALACLTSMLWYGKEGLKKLALTNYQRAAYLKDKLNAVEGITVYSQAPSFNEFVIKFARPLEEVQRHFRSQKIEPGVDLGKYYPELNEHLLVAVTETKSKKQLDFYCQVAEECLHG